MLVEAGVLFRVTDSKYQLRPRSAFRWAHNLSPANHNDSPTYIVVWSLLDRRRKQCFRIKQC